MSNISIQDFESTITHLVNAGVKDNSKGKPMENWIQNTFSLESKSSRITNDGALKNRVSDPFRHEKSIVVFVCKDDLWTRKQSIILEHIETFKYPKLETVLVLTEGAPFVYEKLMVYKKNDFSDWLVEAKGMTAEIQEPVSPKTKRKIVTPINLEDLDGMDIKYLSALRTKPFMLLAGISGTGKSRIVRKLAQASVTEELQKKYDPKSVENCFDRWQLHKPANFELVQVKPNWHNSLEVVGYKSNIGGSHYEFTPFIEFVARAWKHQNIPFFLCLDEMNLAPVEQYFAEFLSAIESRSIENGEYETDPIIKPFVEFGEVVCTQMIDHLVGKVDASKVVPGSIEAKLVERFKTKGLTLPPNLLVLGTVNMDETTFSFSRKVLDRAMSIVMNDVEYDKFFTGETENDMTEFDDATKGLLIDRPIRGLEAEDNGAEQVEQYLTAINEVLNDTPFKLGYRAANEALLYVSAAHQFDGSIDVNAALDEFTLMKILSRIEGDKRSIGNLLDDLQRVINDSYPSSNKKVVQMAKTLQNKQFVSYWT